MDHFVLSFTLYAIPANMIGGMFYVVGKNKACLLKSEYVFIYAPYLALLILSWVFFDDSLKLTDELSLRAFIMAFQAVGAGVLGGLVLWPRFIFPASTLAEKLRITSFSAAVMSAIYVVTRIILFAAMHAVI